MIKILIGFFIKEIIQTLRDPRGSLTLLVIPVFQVVLFGYAISTDVTNLRIASYHNEYDYVLKDIYESSLASKRFIPVKNYPEEPFVLIERGVADLVVIPPPEGFTKSLLRGDGDLQVLINATDVIKSQTIERYLESIIRNVVQKYEGASLSSPSIVFSDRVMFNPALSTPIFMVPATIAMVILISTMTVSGISMLREKEFGTFETLISSPISKVTIILGKIIPYIILGFFMSNVLVLVSYLVFDVPIKGSLAVIMLSSIIFVTVSVSLGVLISSYSKNTRELLLFSLLIVFVMIFLCGILFPIENIPYQMQWVKYINPLYFYISLLRNIMLKGSGVEYYLEPLLVLFIMAASIISLGVNRMKLTI